MVIVKRSDYNVQDGRQFQNY